FTADQLESVLVGAVDDATVPVLDVSHLDFADVAAMRAIAAALRRMTAHRVGVQLRGPTPTFRKVWDSLRLHVAGVELVPT
ncbi:MAG: STAS domain-containing protein, partial [Frankia sp.]|nr:STAS domain-containing protein [Frankia sp.]